MSNSLTYHHKPYTYFVKWSTLQVSYYGCRYAKNCNPSDLWSSYFTSSKQVAAFRKTHGEPDIIQVRKVFNTPAQCTEWEARVLKRLRVGKNNPTYLNLRPGNKNWNNTGMDFTEAARKRRGFAVAKSAATGERLGRISTSDERWATGEIVGATAGYVTGPSMKRNAAISKALKGKKKSSEHQAKIGICNRGMVSALDTRIGCIVRISKTEFDSNWYYEGATAKPRHYIEQSTGNVVMAYRRDIRLLTGELIKSKINRRNIKTVSCLCCNREHYAGHFTRHLTGNYKKK